MRFGMRIGGVGTTDAANQNVAAELLEVIAGRRLVKKGKNNVDRGARL
jgi:hypothetical protein